MTETTIVRLYANGQFSYLTKLSDNTGYVSFDCGNSWKRPEEIDWWTVIDERDQRIAQLEADLWQCRYWLRAVRFVRRLIRGSA